MQAVVQPSPSYDDILRLFQETTLRFQETDLRFQETASRFQETDRIIKQMAQDMSREIKAVNASIGRLSNRLGEFVEEAVRPAAVRLFQERGIDVHEVHQNIVVKRDGEGIEIDLLVVNNKDVVAIECKSNLSVDDVNEHLERLDKIKRLIPDHKDKRITGAVAGMVIPEQVGIYAMRKGLFVIAQNGGHLELANDEKFVAKIW
jgi:hypothetical protein